MRVPYTSHLLPCSCRRHTAHSQTPCFLALLRGAHAHAYTHTEHMQKQDRHTAGASLATEC
jgi:hypothetical protein